MSKSLLIRMSLLLALVLLLAAAPAAAQDAPAYIARGPYPVGTMELMLNAESERPLPVTVWYPALNPDGLPEEILYDTGIRAVLPDIPDMMVHFPGRALLDASPDSAGGPYPLVVYSHSATASRFFTAFYQEHLASWGLVVMAAEHSGSAFTDGFVAPPPEVEVMPYALSVALRMADVKAELDYAEVMTAAGGELEGVIDTDRSAVIGWSLGGNTALVAAGARFDFANMTEWCAAESGREEHCRLLEYVSELASAFGIDPSSDGLWASQGDDRVDAIITMAQGWATAFGEEGYANITIPVMTMLGTGDPQFEIRRSYDLVSSAQKALVAFEGAGHTIYGQCPPAFIEGSFPFCFDPMWDIAAAHEAINHLSVAFLLTTLRGDEDARAALAPEAVSFPDVTYEATGL